MFNIDYARVATAAVGAFILSTMSIAAAVGPAAAGQTAFASIQATQANG